MLGSLAISSLLFISHFVTYSVNPSRIRTQGQYSAIHQCPNTAYSDIMSSIPVCEPRETLVELPLPRDPMIEEVTPSHVLVPRCSGVCFQGNTYHKCVPESGGRSSQTFQVWWKIELREFQISYSYWIWLDSVIIWKMTELLGTL